MESAAATFPFPAATDLSKWRLNVCEGRQFWTYEDKDGPNWRSQSAIDKYHVGLDIVCSPFSLSFSLSLSLLSRAACSPSTIEVAY